VTDFNSAADFAALMCSRLCHDLISPIGAINNGMEMLADDDDEEGNEAVMALIEQSAAQAARKLQFFRLAFGAAGGFSDDLDMQETRKSAEDFVAGSRVNFQWSCALAYAPKHVVKLALNLLLVSVEALIRGGDIQLAIDRTDAEIIIDIRLEGNKLILSDELVALMQGKDLSVFEVESRTAPIFLLKTLMPETMATPFFDSDHQTRASFGVRLAKDVMI